MSLNVGNRTWLPPTQSIIHRYCSTSTPFSNVGKLQSQHRCISLQCVHSFSRRSYPHLLPMSWRLRILIQLPFQISDDLSKWLPSRCPNTHQTHNDVIEKSTKSWCRIAHHNPMSVKLTKLLTNTIENAQEMVTMALQFIVDPPAPSRRWEIIWLLVPFFLTFMLRASLQHVSRLWNTSLPISSAVA